MPTDPNGYTPPGDYPEQPSPSPYTPPDGNAPPPGYTHYTPMGGYPPPGYWPMPSTPQAPESLPDYREPDPQEDRATPRMLLSVSALRSEHLAEIDRQSDFPLWIPVTVASVLLFTFSVTAIEFTVEQNIPQANGLTFLCLMAAVVFGLFVALATGRRRQEKQRLMAYAAVAQETAGVVEIYADRLVRITPHTRTIVWLRTPQTVVWESPRLLTVSDGYAAIAIPAENLTADALKNLRQTIYPAIPPHNRKSTGRMFPQAAELPELPNIQLSEELLYRFSYQPDQAAERDRRTMSGVRKALPFVAITAVMAGVMLGSLFRTSLPFFGMVAMCALGSYCVLQLLTYAVIRQQVKAAEWAPSSIGIAFTLGGLAVEEYGCVRFIPHGWYKYTTKKESLVLQLPIGQLYIPWADIPDRDVVKRLLMLGD